MLIALFKRRRAAKSREKVGWKTAGVGFVGRNKVTISVRSGGRIWGNGGGDRRRVWKPRTGDNEDNNGMGVFVFLLAKEEEEEEVIDPISSRVAIHFLREKRGSVDLPAWNIDPLTSVTSETGEPISIIWKARSTRETNVETRRIRHAAHTNRGNKITNSQTHDGFLIRHTFLRKERAKKNLISNSTNIRTQTHTANFDTFYSRPMLDIYWFLGRSRLWFFFSFSSFLLLFVVVL